MKSWLWDKTSKVFHKFSTSRFLNKTPNPWTIELSIRVIVWCIIMVRVRHRLNFPPIEQPFFQSLLINLTFRQECHTLIRHSNNCHTYCCKFKRLLFITLIMMSTHPHLACNNFIFFVPMPLHHQLISHLIICLYWIVASSYLF